MQISNPEVEVTRKLTGGCTPGGKLAAYSVYSLALVIATSLWLLPIRCALDLDETGSYWVISQGFGAIWPRAFNSISFVAYSYALWFWTKLFGSSEIALRASSLAAMLGAVYLLYLAARKMLDTESALFAAVVFSLHPIVAYAAVDVRPYAFSALLINAAIFTLISLRRNDSNWLAALFGFLVGSILWFQFLFAVILPVFAICFFVVKDVNRKTVWRQFRIALGTLTLAILPTFGGLHNLFRTRASHVYETAPTVIALIATAAPIWLLLVLICAIPISLLASTFSRSRSDDPEHVDRWSVAVCLLLGLIPVLILFGISVATPTHMFAPRHRLVSLPGIALCWGILFSRFRSRMLRALVCAAMVALVCLLAVTSASSRRHDVSWKYALEFAQTNNAPDRAPVVICSGFVESNFETMPLDSPKTSDLFAPLSYYHLTVPVVPLPQQLNAEALRVGSLFLRDASQKPERFLVMGDHLLSRGPLDWFVQNTKGSYDSQLLGIFDGIEIREFTPHYSAP